MGQFLEYLASVFTSPRGNKNLDDKGSKSNHVTFSDGSFSQVFGSRDEQAQKLNTLRQSNMKTICTYEFIVFVTLLAHFSVVTWPKIQADSFNLNEPDGWQLVTLNLIPLVVQIGAISAMIELNKPLPEGTRITSKNAGLELDNNDYIKSLKAIIVLMVLCQVSSMFFDVLLWSVVMIVPLWCFSLTSRLARSEYDKHAPSPKKQWVKLNLAKSPKVVSTPNKITGSAKKAETEATKATPRTRARRAVRNFVSGVSDKYHTLEQNIHQQISSKTKQNFMLSLEGAK